MVAEVHTVEFSETDNTVIISHNRTRIIPIHTVCTGTNYLI